MEAKMHKHNPLIIIAQSSLLAEVGNPPALPGEEAELFISKQEGQQKEGVQITRTLAAILHKQHNHCCLGLSTYLQSELSVMLPRL